MVRNTCGPRLSGCRVCLVIRFACTQDGKIGVEQHLGVSVLTGIMRFRFPNEGSNPMAFWDGQFLAEPLGVFGTAFFIVRSLAVVDHVMEPSSQLHGIQVLGIGSQALHRGKHGQDMIEGVVEAAWASISLRTI